MQENIFWKPHILWSVTNIIFKADLDFRSQGLHAQCSLKSELYFPKTAQAVTVAVHFRPCIPNMDFYTGLKFLFLL
jgi:hypothetical protein